MTKQKPKEETKTNTLKIGNLQINVHSSFLGEKKLEDTLFSLASMCLKEKLA